MMVILRYGAAFQPLGPSGEGIREDEPDEGESLENPKRSLRVGRNDQGLRERVREG